MKTCLCTLIYMHASVLSFPLLYTHTKQCINLRQNNLYDADDAWVRLSHAVDVYS